MGVMILVGTLQNTAISYRLSEVGVPVICRDDFQKSTSRIVGVVGGVVGFSILSLLIWFFLRRRSREVPFHVTRRPSSHRTLSTRSYYPSSASVYSNDEPEMDESGGQAPGVYVRFFSAFPRYGCGFKFLYCTEPFVHRTLRIHARSSRFILNYKWRIRFTDHQLLRSPREREGRQ